MRPPFYPPKPTRAWAGTDLHRALIDDPRWVVEPKIDGDRCLVFVGEGGGEGAVELWSRHGRRFTHPWLATLCRQVAGYRLPAGTVLDGELVALKGDPPRLYLHDLASEYTRPLKWRRPRLRWLCPARSDAPGVTVLSWLRKDGAYERALEAGHEGVVWKRLDSQYEWQRGTSGNEVAAWLKMKPL